MFQPEKIIKRQRVTEKATTLMGNFNQYTFEVYPQVNRREVAAAVERVFKVEVARVNIINYKGKVKANRMRRAAPSRVGALRKAIVTLKEGHSIDTV